MPIEFGEDTLIVFRVLAWALSVISVPIYFVYRHLSARTSMMEKRIEMLDSALNIHLQEGARAEDIQEVKVSLDRLSRRIDHVFMLLGGKLRGDED